MNCSSLWRVLPAVALIAFAASASAGDWDDCPKVAEPARAVPACTRIIGTEKNRRQMAIAYANRCSAHNAKGQLEAAKADCDKAIDLNPGYVGGHLNRVSHLIYKGISKFCNSTPGSNNGISANSAGRAASGRFHCGNFLRAVEGLSTCFLGWRLGGALAGIKKGADGGPQGVYGWV